MTSNISTTFQRSFFFSLEKLVVGVRLPNSNYDICPVYINNCRKLLHKLRYRGLWFFLLNLDAITCTSHERCHYILIVSNDHPHPFEKGQDRWYFNRISAYIYRINELHVVFCLYHFLFEKVGHLQISGSVVFLVINNSFVYMAFPILVAFCLTYLPYLIIIQPFLNIPPSFFFFFSTAGWYLRWKPGSKDCYMW